MAALSQGICLGPYEILDAVGAGGMGEVYRARDTRLDRIVAVKVLTADLAASAAARERFEREARAISSLNHPNICVLYDIGRARPSAAGSEVDFLVMEYLEGETLAARLARSPMKVEEVLSVAIQMAAALDRAHRQGIVHRDLKPGNVMLTGSGVKLLDFGLARLAQSEDAAAPADHAMTVADVAMPTETSPLTMKGVIVGTLQYMAPEQLRGERVDTRSDIFAFGGVLYEMLTRRRAFEGRSRADVVDAILEQPAPMVTASRPQLPPALDAVVARCLAKPADDRWQSIRDVQWQLKDLAAAGAAEPAAGSQLGVGMLLAAVLATLVIGGAAVWRSWPSPPAPPVVARFTTELPEDQFFTRTGRRYLAMSPDGSRIAYIANQQIYLRELRDLIALPVGGTAGADPSELAFSPDSQWIAFWSAGQLKKVPIAGGTPTVLSEAQNPYGLSWDGDRIVLGQTTPRGIIEVPASGGAPRHIVRVDEAAEQIAQSPQLLPGGEAVLFTLRTGNQTWDQADIVIEELATSQRTVLVSGGTNGRVLESGHLVFLRDGAVMAAALDRSRRAVVGEAVPITQGVAYATAGFSGSVQVSWSDTSMVYVPDGLMDERALVWLDRAGDLTPVGAPNRVYQALSWQTRLSPDGTRIAVTVVSVDPTSTRPGRDIWIWDITRDALTRVTSTARAESPIWTPDGRRLCYQTPPDVFCQSLDGGQPERVFSFDGLRSLGDFTPDGKQLVFHAFDGTTLNDVLVATLGDPPTITPLLNSPSEEAESALSPDGRWLAYLSNESGANDVFVRPFPDTASRRWQISNAGAVRPRWSSDGRQLYFLEVSNSLGASQSRGVMSVDVAPGREFRAGTPVSIVRHPALTGRNIEPGPDGRFLLNVAARAAAGAPVQGPQYVVVQNWVEELKARLAGKD